MAETKGMAGIGRIYQINISRGGVPKLPVEQAEVTKEGLTGDYHNDVRDHGGPMRALCLYTLEQIQRLQAEAHPIFPGLAGENITLQGIDQAALVPGARMALGDRVEIELTDYASPCKTITGSFYDGNFTRISHKTHPGESRIYAKILRAGAIRAGDTVRLLN